IQYALQGDELFVLEVNPRASRTVPFVSKATGVNWVQVATRCIVGQTLNEQKIIQNLEFNHFAVKEVVFPFNRFEGVSTFLGPEMRSTGEVMGIADTFSEAYSKALYASGDYLPTKGKVFISINERDHERVVPIAQKLSELGFEIIATRGTGETLRSHGIESEFVYKVNEGRPNIIDHMKNNDVQLLINTPLGSESYYDERIVGETAYRMGLPLITTLPAAKAVVAAIEAIGNKPLKPIKLQELWDDK
ncbi:MAG: carbamoyl phosphate synthase large subunit, partial [Calditrichaeota bacterium]|nr:carbamoyl phosphate synthase large subunit [Calditrichota bacterium]